MICRVLYCKPSQVRSPISKEKFVCMAHSAMCHKRHVSKTKEVNESICHTGLGIFSSTIKNNILFGEDYDHKLFQRVIHAAALEEVRQTTKNILKYL